MVDIRYDFVFETGEEEDRDFGYGGKVSVRGPDLVAEEC